uniref:Secreted protein n=1 Tax=Knipowitschia caucasica TaxID=637954 RepID=A0AAV2K003_KNICA
MWLCDVVLMWLCDVVLMWLCADVVMSGAGPWAFTNPHTITPGMPLHRERHYTGNAITPGTPLHRERHYTGNAGASGEHKGLMRAATRSGCVR